MSREREPPMSRLAVRLWEIIRERPGIHFRALGRAAQIRSGGQLRHHLDRLEDRGAVVEVQEGGYKRFFVVGDQDPALRAEIALLSRHVTHLIGVLLLERAMTRTELRRSLGCADSTLGFHLARMLTQGELVRHREGNHQVYQLKNKDLVRRALLVQQDSAQKAAQAEPVPAESSNGASVPSAPAMDTQDTEFRPRYERPDQDLLRPLAPEDPRPEARHEPPKPLVASVPVPEHRGEEKDPRKERSETHEV